MRTFRRFAGAHSRLLLTCARVCCLLLLIVLLSACATFRPAPLEQVPFQQRAESKSDGAMHVSAVALSAEESAAAFGVPLAEDGIQPVWFRVENGEDLAYFFFPTAVDPNHFSPQEAAWKEYVRDACNFSPSGFVQQSSLYWTANSCFEVFPKQELTF